jgi:hypothetical protein
MFSGINKAAKAAIPDSHCRIYPHIRAVILLFKTQLEKSHSSAIHRQTG